METMYNPQSHNHRINVPNSGASGYNQSSQHAHRPHHQSPPVINRGVEFNESKKDQEYRQRILTVKYGSHQMKLIRKRLAIEDWLDSQLRALYRCENDTDDYDTEIDLDEVLDLDSISERQQFLREKVANARRSPDVVDKFIEELLEKVNTL